MKALALIIAVIAISAIFADCQKTENRKELKIKINDKADTESLKWSLKS